MTTPVTTKTAFLDTNALVLLFGFWEACKIADVAMDSVASWQDLRTELEAKGMSSVDSFKSDDFKIISDGLRCFENLSDVKGSFDYFSCQVSCSELHHVILASEADESLIRRRVPWSVRKKRPLVVFRTALENSDYDRIERQLDNFFDTLLHEQRINIRILEESGYGPTVASILQTAKAIWSRLLIETMDAYIYAAAIECEADYFLTADSALIQATNSLNNPSAEWQHVEQALRDALGKPSAFKFPKGVRPSRPFT